MIAFRATAIAASLVTGAVLPTTAQQSALDMRTGLWEIASERSSSGMPAAPAMPQIPPDVLAKMPAAQRAQIEGALRASRGAQTGKKVTKVCLTAEAIRKGPEFGLPREANCKVNKNTRSARGWQLEQTCMRGASRQTLSVRYDLVDRETVNGTVDVAMHDGGQTMTMKQTMQGRWLGADCGNVRPLD